MISGDVPRTNVLESADIIRMVRDYHTGAQLVGSRYGMVIVSYSMLIISTTGRQQIVFQYGITFDHCRIR